jgi:trehalose 6-phosphate phosphatase
MIPPELDRKSALFLDLDGTLLEIAATPELVVVPPALPALLAHLHHQLDGAVAIVSGRPMGQIDQLLAPFRASAAGEHGVSLRFSDGTLEELPVGVAVPESWRETLDRTSSAGPACESRPSRMDSPCTIVSPPSAKRKCGSWCAGWCRPTIPGSG